MINAGLAFVVEDIEDGSGEKLHKALVCMPLSPVFSRYTGGLPHFIDEPVNGLDPMGIIEFRKLFLRLNRENNVTIILSSHILNELECVATHYGFLYRGNLIKETSNFDVSQSAESLEQYYEKMLEECL